MSMAQGSNDLGRLPPSPMILAPTEPLSSLASLVSSTGPLTQLVKRSLQVSNPNNQPVAFKVKTTAPKQYCVRPNSGRIEPGEKVEVQGESRHPRSSCRTT